MYRNKQRIPRHAGGFTLIELLVALALFAFMYAMFSGFFTQFMNGRDQITERAAEIESLQKALAWMTLDFEQVIARPIRDEYGDTRPAMTLTEAGGVEFTRSGWANPFDLYPRSQLQRVLYQVHDNKLYRRYWDAPDRTEVTPFHDAILLEGVEQMTVRFLQETESEGYSWVEFWPTLEQQALDPLYQPLPASIEIVLELTNGQVLRRYFRLVSNPWFQVTS